MKRWTHTLNVADVFHNDDLSIEQIRDAIVARIKAARFYDEDDMPLWGAVDGLAAAEDEDEFYDWWDEFYDWCDANSVWVQTTTWPAVVA